MRGRASPSLVFAGAVGLAFWSSLGPAAGGETSPDFRVGGLLFGDLYYVASHHTEEGDGAAGAVLRRGYLTFDADFGARWSARLRFEVNQSGEFETYTFEADVKDLSATLHAGEHDLVFGRSPTPTFDLVESVWGLRYLARTPLDLQGVASRDVGVAARGPLNQAGTVGYRAMVGSGLEFGHESGDGWKWMGAVSWEPGPPWILDVYLDHEQLEGPVDRTTVQGFAAYRTDGVRGGVLVSNQDRGEDPPLRLASGFVVGRLGAGVSLAGRVDRLFEPSPRGDDIAYLPYDPRTPATTAMAGVQFDLAPHLVLTPNTVVTVYDRDEEGTRPGTDLHWRLTLFVDLE